MTTDIHESSPKAVKSAPSAAPSDIVAPMNAADARERWDARYRTASPPSVLAPPQIVSTWLVDIAPGARVLDIACGFGDAGLWLAQRGAQVTLADISGVVIGRVNQRATELTLDVETQVTDLETAVPEGPWDIITCVHYLDRAMLSTLSDQLAPSGRVAVAIATTTNLERHERPSARFLLEPGELPELVTGTTTVHFDEDWRTNEVHEAWLIAEKN